MSVAALLDGLSTANIADACDHVGVPCRYLSKQLRYTHGEKFWGYADTVMWGPTRKGSEIIKPSPSTWQDVGAFVADIKDDGTQKVYVAGCREISDEYVLAGGMSLTFIEKRRYQAAILFGAVRDYEEIKRLSIPVWYSNLAVMDSQGCMKVESRGAGCLFSGHWIAQNDLIVGDANGVICVGINDVEKVLSRAQDIKHIEDDVLAKIQSGLDLFELVNKGGHI
ncbi:RraA family protein [Sessilibacter sp. MAH4]